MPEAPDMRAHRLAEAIVVRLVNRADSIYNAAREVLVEEFERTAGITNPPDPDSLDLDAFGEWAEAHGYPTWESVKAGLERLAEPEDAPLPEPPPEDEAPVEDSDPDEDLWQESIIVVVKGPRHARRYWHPFSEEKANEIAEREGGAVLRVTGPAAEDILMLEEAHHEARWEAEQEMDAAEARYPED